MIAHTRRRQTLFRRCLFTVAAVALAGGLVGAGGGAALAQDSRVQGLIDRVDRLQRELVTLQRQVYRGEPPPAPAAAPDAAAPTESGGLSTTAAARLELRLSQFEAELRALTGQVEELSFRYTQVRDRLDKLAADTDLRLQQLERGGAGMAGAPGEPAPGGLAAPGQAQARAGQSQFATQPQTLGQISEEDLQALQREGVQSGGAASADETQHAYATPETSGAGYTLSGATPEEQYKQAFGLLSQANYAEAELALRAFVEQNPDSPLAGNAKYWLGETYYVRQDYQQAAVTFAEAYQQYPDSSKAPDNLLKLGMALAALDSTSDACGTFSELLRRYPDAAVTVQERAKQERQRLACP